LIYKPDALVRHVYFPTSGIISLLADVDGGGTLEVGIVGREGMAGMSVFMGVKTLAQSCRGPGRGFRLENEGCDSGKYGQQRQFPAAIVATILLFVVGSAFSIFCL